MKRLFLLTVPALSLLFAGPVRADDLALGKDLFAANCARCHGEKAQGDQGPKLVGEPAGWQFALFKRAVRSGRDDENHKLKKGMPRFEKAKFKTGAPPTDDQIKAIQAYLISISPTK